MSFVSQVLGGGGVEIGDIMLTAEAGSKYTVRGRVFARAGTVYPSASYPLAAAEPRTMVNGLPSSVPENVNVSGWATNGSGIFVVAYGDGTNVLVSTDNGQTWSTQAHGVGISATDVAYNGTRFIVVGNTTSAVYCRYSTNGTSWSGSANAPVTSAVADTAHIAADGTTALIVVAGTDVANAATTTDGSTLTARSLAVSTSATTPFIAVLPSLGGTRWLVGSGASNWNQSTTSGATAFTSVSTPSGSGVTTVGLAAGAGIFVAFVAGTPSYYTSSNGTSWTLRGLPGFSVSAGSTDDFVPFAVARANWVHFDGTRFVTSTATPSSNAAQGVFGYSTDGIEWITRQLTYPSTQNGLVVMSGNGGLAALPTGSSNRVGAQYSASWLTTCDYVGKARPISTKAATISNTSMSMAGYVRIK